MLEREAIGNPRAAFFLAGYQFARPFGHTREGADLTEQFDRTSMAACRRIRKIVGQYQSLAPYRVRSAQNRDEPRCAGEQPIEFFRIDRRLGGKAEHAASLARFGKREQAAVHFSL